MSDFLDRLKFSQDLRQTLTMVFNFLLDSFRVAMASFLAVFVPQDCAGNVCSMTENFSNIIDYNAFVLAMNFFTFLCFGLLYRIEICRERYLITHLERDDTKSDLHVQVLTNTYPEIGLTLTKLNRQYYYAYCLIALVYALNFLFSAVLVLYFYYLDYRSATTLFTNALLCVSKIYKGYMTASESYKRNLALSFFNVQNLAFNEIDPSYRDKRTDKTLEELMAENDSYLLCGSRTSSMKFESTINRTTLTLMAGTEVAVKESDV